MKRQQNTPGAIVEINIENQYFVYAQILINGAFAFFDYRSKEHLKDFSILSTAPVLFIVVVYRDVVSQGHWLKVGKMPIREDLKIMPNKFIYDVIGHKFELYDPNTGKITPSTRDECYGLEAAAVWEAYHVEERIRDHYLSVPNIWVELIQKDFKDYDQYIKKKDE